MSKRKKGAAPREVEPRVPTEDVQAILHRIVQPGQESEGDSVATIAEKADTSTRTVYRVLAGTTKTLSLDLADRLCIAADAHLSECRLQWPDGRVEAYFQMRAYAAKGKIKPRRSRRRSRATLARLRRLRAHVRKRS